MTHTPQEPRRRSPSAPTPAPDAGPASKRAASGSAVPKGTLVPLFVGLATLSLLAVFTVPVLVVFFVVFFNAFEGATQVPDDVILLFADDNWGQIRRLPAVGSQRQGGYGVYYHFDYVGGPRSYKWLNLVARNPRGVVVGARSARANPSGRSVLACGAA